MKTQKDRHTLIEAVPLKEWRLSRHWSLQTLAREAGLSLTALRHAERGQKVRELTKRKIAEVLGIDVEARNSDNRSTLEVLALREWRLRKYWSMRELARRANISPASVRRGEGRRISNKGKKDQLWEPTQRRIAGALGVRVDQIEEFAEEQQL